MTSWTVSQQVKVSSCYLSYYISIQQVLMFYEHSHHKLCVVKHSLHILCTETTELQLYRVSVIVLSLIVLVLTGLLVGALVIILKRSKLTSFVCQHQITCAYHSGCDQKMREEEEEPETDVNMAYGTPREIMAHRNAAL